MVDSSSLFHPRRKAIFFDFMGTCLDWHSSIVSVFPQRLTLEQKSSLAIRWREAFFKDIHDRFEKKLPQEDIDVTHRRLLEGLLGRDGDFSEEEKEKAVKAWHRMEAWADVSQALAKLKSKSLSSSYEYELFVLANGTTRLQLDLAHSSGLNKYFDMLFSSQLLSLTKPDLAMYRKALDLVGCTPEESIMVAAHAYDLRAAKEVGMKTVYVRRWTEDTSLMEEDFQTLKKDVDLFLGRVESEDGLKVKEELDGDLLKLVQWLDQ